MPDYSGDYYMPTYTYFLLDKTGVSEQTSSRTYNFTEFAKLDSSYITGSFYYWDQKTAKLTEVGALGLPTLEFMRNEILADTDSNLPTPSIWPDSATIRKT